MARLNEVPFIKGHGTGNDFVIIPDIDGHLDLTPEQVRWLCDRHVGIGGNGVLRVVRTEHVCISSATRERLALPAPVAAWIQAG